MGGKIKNLIGERFGRLVVQLFSHQDKHGKFCWICICDCGNITKPIATGALRSGHISSCGCLREEINKKKGKNAKDILGQVFGYLTALRPTDKRSGSNIIWECLCICGNLCEVSRSNLTNGHTTSCGCRRISKFHEDVRQDLLDLGIEVYAEEYAIRQEYFKLEKRTTIIRVDIMVWSPKGRGLIAIECQGRQHYTVMKHWGGEEGYKRQIELDTLKKACLQIMNVPLIEVRYDEKNIEKFLRKKLF